MLQLALQYKAIYPHFVLAKGRKMYPIELDIESVIHENPAELARQVMQEAVLLYSGGGEISGNFV